MFIFVALGRWFFNQLNGNGYAELVNPLCGGLQAYLAKKGKPDGAVDIGLSHYSIDNRIVSTNVTTRPILFLVCDLGLVLLRCVDQVDGVAGVRAGRT